jgi:hypothetical protein
MRDTAEDIDLDVTEALLEPTRHGRTGEMEARVGIEPA